ncbi:MAG: hypothetical protein OEZ48_11270 [Candidatus Bathyarchaeota archaeon]|nr:hypothetical protein [Candidatus Bathyarchaeota archaeon]MDH5688424.1 hypothetical protein [Candidatus Bathyarchaeota archaeon]
MSRRFWGNHGSSEGILKRFSTFSCVSDPLTTLVYCTVFNAEIAFGAEKLMETIGLGWDLKGRASWREIYRGNEDEP